METHTLSQIKQSLTGTNGMFSVHTLPADVLVKPSLYAVLVTHYLSCGIEHEWKFRFLSARQDPAQVGPT